MLKLENTAANARKLAASIIASNVTPIFDLDGVIINANHRQINNPDGSLNLSKYRKMSTAEHIKKDLALPLLETIKILNDQGVRYHVCTARVMCVNTEAWLHSHEIKPHTIMARSGDHDSRKDWKLKTTNLLARFNVKQLNNMVLIDDNLDNCKAMAKIGVNAIMIPFEGH
jgi:hypothetical protein